VKALNILELLPTLTSKITEFETGIILLMNGKWRFKWFRHKTYFVDNGTLMTDIFEYESP
jgi:hypothetical protein